jgi:hypothetical protein
VDEAQNSGRKWSCRFRISRVALTIAQNEAESHITETTTATLVAGGWFIWPQTSELWAAGRSGARPLQRGRVGASRWRTGSRRLPLPGQPWVRSAQAGTAWARPGRGRRRSLAGWQPEGGLDPGLGPGMAFSDFQSLGHGCCLAPGPGQERARHRPAGNLRRRIYQGSSGVRQGPTVGQPQRSMLRAVIGMGRASGRVPSGMCVGYVP